MRNTFVLACSVAALLLQLALHDARAATTAEVDFGAPMLLVATKALDASPYRETVLLAFPSGAGGHVGFVLNRSTEATVASLFPGDKAAQLVTAPVSVGGPLLQNAMFALVRGAAADRSGLLEVTPQVSVALSAGAVDRVLTDKTVDARFFVGLVVWQADQLANELRAGAWDVIPPETDLVLSKNAAGLWEQLASRTRGALALFVPASRRAGIG